MCDEIIKLLRSRRSLYNTWWGCVGGRELRVERGQVNFHEKEEEHGVIGGFVGANSILVLSGINK